MRYSIVHRSPDRLRLALARGRLSSREADVLYYALLERRDVVKVQVFARTGEVAIRFRQSADASATSAVRRNAPAAAWTRLSPLTRSSASSPTMT